MFLPLRQTVNILKHNVFVYPTTRIKMSTDYEKAVDCINLLQSNTTYIQQAANKGIVPHSAIYSTTIAETQKYLLRTGVTLDDLDKLSVIHVAGTKGKGSTCAFCESILRQYGYKTGFFSSPHLVAIRERVKLNGKPLTQEIFAKNVFRIYNLLMDQRDHAGDMPAYFRFLTILAFNIFIQEKVDVAVVEVGIGGEYDCTNILRKTPIAGITSLGIDHTSMLGDTIEQIAWQKSGIMKKHSKVYTIPHSEVIMKILQDRSIERECSLETVPNYEDYVWTSGVPKLGINGEVQKINASLAIQLAHNWMEYCGNNFNLSTSPLVVPETTKQSLETCKWPGRNQIIKQSTITFYLDGAHTTDSIEICAEWFKTVSSPAVNVNKVLLFNATGNRNSEELLQKLSTLDLNYIIFVPNITASAGFADQMNVLNTQDKQMERCQQHKNIWMKLQTSETQQVLIFPSVKDALEHLPKTQRNEILVTGSLHLVGAALSLLDPDLKTF